MGKIIIVSKKSCRKCNALLKETIELEYRNGEFKPIWLKRECNCVSRSISVEALKDGYEPTLFKLWNETCS